MESSLSHVAVLVRAAERARAVCLQAGYELGPVDEFPSEGTRETYVGPPEGTGLLLLMEAIGPGAYRRALEKRGPGLHHIAINVDGVEAYIERLVGSGWLLHPASLQTLADRGTAYLARPGLGALIEVQPASSGTPPSGGNRFVSEVFVEGARDQQRLLDALGVEGLSLAGNEGAAVVIGGRRLAVADLARG